MMFFFCLQCSMLWSCSASKISTELCRGCLTWRQIKTKKSTKSTIFTLVSFLIDCLGVAEKREKKTCSLISLFVLRFVRRSVLPSSSPRWQKNQMDIKMYLSGVVQVCSLLHVSLCFSPLRFQACVFLWGRYMKYRDSFLWIFALKLFLASQLQLLSSLTEATVICAVLKHTNQLVPYYLCLPKQCRHLIKVRPPP